MNHSKQVTILSIAVAVLFVSTLLLLYFNFSKTPIVSTTITGVIPTEVTTPTSTTDPTADWKTYEDGNFSFSFFYPGNLHIETPKNESSRIYLWENGINSAAFYNSNYGEGSTGAIPTVQPFLYLQHLEDKISDLTAVPTDNSGPVELSYIKKIDNVSPLFKVYSYGQEISEQVCATGTPDNKTLIISCSDDQLNDPVFQQILSTFKFTDTTTTSVRYPITNNSGQNLYLVFPGNTVINKDMVTINGSTFNIDTNVGPGLCTEGVDDPSCDYTEVSNTKWAYYRIWTEGTKPFAVNPQVLSEGGVSSRGLIITKESPDKYFTAAQLSQWKEILNNVQTSP